MFLGTLLGTGGDQSNILLERHDGSGGVASFEGNDGLTVCRVTSNSNLELIGKIEKWPREAGKAFARKPATCCHKGNCESKAVTNHTFCSPLAMKFITVTREVWILDSLVRLLK